MRLMMIRLFIIAFTFLLFRTLSAQTNCSPTNINGTVFNFPCGQTCINLGFQIPHLKATSDYAVTQIPYNPYPYVTPTGVELTSTYVDDEYSNVIDIPFTFCFYDSVYTKCVVGSNGIVTFDETVAGLANAYTLTVGGAPQTIPYAGGFITAASIGETYYPPASIMGAYHDIWPNATSNLPPDRKIEYSIVGTAPCRKFVVSYYNVPMYGSGCTAFYCTQQIVLHETTGLVEVFFLNKPVCSNWENGRAILGVQNWARDKAVAAPGKNCTAWTEQNTGYQFVPSGGASRFVRSELLSMSGTVLQTADTITTTAGLLDISFANQVCPPASGTQYIVRTIYSSCSNPTEQLISMDTITINMTNTLGATATTTDATCGPPNGTINVSIPAGIGVAPFNYSLDGGVPITGGTNFTFFNVTAAPHTVVVTDLLGCTSNIPVTVSMAGGLTAVIATTPTSCVGVSNGTITVTPNSGVAPYQYTINGGPPQAGNTFTGLADGNYVVGFTDASGCAGSFNVTVSAGSPGLTGVAAATPTSCAGANNGAITVTPNSGLAPYQYSLNGGPSQASNVFTGLASGNYVIAFTDAAGCSGTLSATVDPGSPGLTGVAVSTPTSCAGASNGAITVTPNSGQAPYQYSLNGGPSQASNIFNGLASGNHVIVFTDAAGCTGTLDVLVDPGSPGLTGAVTTTPTSCAGVNNGTVTATPNNGLAPFQYSLNGGPLQAGNTFSGLAPGNYVIVFSDAAGCSGTLNATVNPGMPLSTTTTQSNVLCNGGNSGSVTVNMPTNGTAPYEYSIDGVNYQSANTFIGLTAGSYTIWFRDANSCAGSLPVTITQPTTLSMSVPQQAVVCNGGNTGQILPAGTGGTAPYQYSLDGINFQGGNSFNVSAGSYTVYVSDNNGCTVSQQVTITEPAILAASAGSTNASCDGGDDGTITVTANGGNAAYQYSIDNTNFQASNTFNVAPGTYTVVVRDNLGCTANTQVTVALNNNLMLNPAADQLICEGNSVQLQTSSNAIQYSWSPATGLSNVSIANPIASPIVTTQYTVTATLGRCNTQDDIIVNVNPAPVPNAGPDGDICFGQTFQLQGSGGVSYSWSPSTYLSATDIANPVATPDNTTQYLLNVIDANGCASLIPGRVTVNVTPPIRIFTSPSDTIVHAGDKFQVIASSAATIYRWTPSVGLDNATIPTPVITVSTDMIYTVEATTSAGCKGEANVIIKVYKGPDLYVPTAFSPNNDGRNDIFKPFPVGIRELRYFKVFNRWGQMLYSTSQLHEGWDGRLGGSDQGTGVYVWMAQAVTADGSVITKQGTVMLIR